MTTTYRTRVKTKPFLSLRLLTAAWWASFFAAAWVDLLQIVEANSAVITFFAGAVLFSALCFLQYAYEKKPDE